MIQAMAIVWCEMSAHEYGAGCQGAHVTFTAWNITDMFAAASAA